GAVQGRNQAVLTDIQPRRFGYQCIRLLDRTNIGWIHLHPPRHSAPPYLVALERMQDDVLPVPAADIRAIVEAELGVRLGKLFQEFDDVPLGLALLAQVHRAVLMTAAKWRSRCSGRTSKTSCTPTWTA